MLHTSTMTPSKRLGGGGGREDALQARTYIKKSMAKQRNGSGRYASQAEDIQLYAVSKQLAAQSSRDWPNVSNHAALMQCCWSHCQCKAHQNASSADKECAYPDNHHRLLHNVRDLELDELQQRLDAFLRGHL